MIEYNERAIVPIIPKLDDDTVILRYMTFDKFRWLIENSALYFPRVDNEAFKEQNEMYVTEINARTFRLSLEDFRVQCERERKSAFINCWTIDDRDNAYMWGKFTDGADGIAIKSTVRRLMESEKSNDFTYISKVRYYNPETESAHPFGERLNTNWLLASKSNEFSSEKELRLFHYEDNKEYYTVKIDLHVLIDEIIISPKADNGYVDAVRDLLVKHGLDKIKLLRPGRC